MDEKVGAWVNLIVNAEPEWLRPWINANVLSAWVVIAVLLVLVRLTTRKMEMRPTRFLQVAFEWAYDAVMGFSRNMIGPGGEKHAPYLGTLFVYILLMNLVGLVPGFISPTASLVMTFSLSIPTVLYVWISGFRAHGIAYLKHFTAGVPWALAPFMVVIEVVGHAVRMLSLAVRLFGNIFGEDTVIAQLLAMSAGIFAAIHVPIPLHWPMQLFHLLISLVQAVVFTMLAAAYIGEAVEHQGDEASAHPKEYAEAAHAA